MTSQQVSEREVSAEETTSVETGVRDSLVAAGVVAAFSVLGETCGGARCRRSTDCFIVIKVQPPNDCTDDDVDGQMTLQSQYAYSADSTGGDTDDVVRTSSPSGAGGRLGRMLGRLTVRSGQQTDGGGKRELAQRCHSWSGCSRRVAIESSLSAERSTSRRRRPRYSDDCRGVDDDDVQDDERTIQQFSMSLTSTDVRDGRFTARLPVNEMPRGDVMIRLRNGRLEVLQTELSDCGDRAPRRLHGVIDLPIYVDPGSVTVRHDALQQCLVIEATTKGYQQRAGLRRRSLSMDDLWWSRGRKVAHDLGVLLTKSTWKRREAEPTVVLCSDSRAVVDHSRE